MKQIPPPIETAIVTPSGHCTEHWAMFFQQVASRVREGTLAQKPTNLGQGQGGLLFHATDYDRWWRWNGTAWERAPWELPTLFVGMFCTAPGTGWKLLDGTGNPFTYTTAAAGTATITISNAQGAYPKLGGFTGNLLAAIAPVISGSTAAEAAHTHSADHDHPTQDTGAQSDVADVQAGTGTSVSVGHHHALDLPNMAVTTGAGSSHLHAKGTLVNDTSGQPDRMEFLPYVRL